MRWPTPQVIVNSAVRNVGLQVNNSSTFDFASFGYIPNSGIAIHLANVGLIFEGACYCFNNLTLSSSGGTDFKFYSRVKMLLFIHLQRTHFFSLASHLLDKKSCTELED